MPAWPERRDGGGVCEAGGGTVPSRSGAGLRLTRARPPDQTGSLDDRSRSTGMAGATGSGSLASIGSWVPDRRSCRKPEESTRRARAHRRLTCSAEVSTRQGAPRWSRHFPRSFARADQEAVARPRASPRSTGRRTALADWLVRPDHPLTARVMVNRLWQQHFGRGLVATTSDFGAMGDEPSHPELLDWLATEFVARGWSMKAMHRLIVTSATYRQSSRLR